MSDGMPQKRAITTISLFLASPRFIAALTTAIVGVSASSFALRQLMGWAGLVAILSALVLLAIASFFASREVVEWRGLLPVSLLAFLAWAGLSLAWSQYRWATLGGLAYLGCFTIVGLYVALLRDSIQVVRAFGDVLRFVLAVSLCLEIFAGILIDAPIGFLGIAGKLDELGPIQGITGTRNQIAILALIALVTFGTELRTHMISRGFSIGSIVLAGFALLLSRSPLAIGALVILCVAGAALYGLRRVKAERRRFLQLGLLTAAVVLLAIAWAFRSVIVELFNAGGDLTYRLAIWRKVWELVQVRPLQGWGWTGTWHEDITPFQLFADVGARQETSASNAYIDVWLQLGFVGLALFLGLAALAFVRSWLLASRRRSVLFAWPALSLVALIVTSLGESSTLVELGWLTFVICTLKASQHLSWRRAFESLE